MLRGRDKQSVGLQCRGCRRGFFKMLDVYDLHFIESGCGAWCDECAVRHHGRRCERCGKTGCGHVVADCDLCGRQVCFKDPRHSVRVEGKTCCLECVRSMDVRPRVAALLDHLPGGVVRGVAGVLQRGAPPEPYGGALVRATAQWTMCSVCRVRAPELRKANGTCGTCGTCGRMSRWIRARCAACGPWHCRNCRAAYNA
jgi:hypothetical protein